MMHTDVTGFLTLTETDNDDVPLASWTTKENNA